MVFTWSHRQSKNRHFTSNDVAMRQPCLPCGPRTTAADLALVRTVPNLYWIWKKYSSMWTVKRSLNLSPVSNTGCGKPCEMENVSVRVHLSVYGGRLMRNTWKKKEKRKRENQTSTDGQEKVMDLITRECSRHRTSHPPCGVTLFCCTVCRSWRRCWTRAAESAAGTGPVGTASGGWSRGSGWLWLNRCAEYSQWDRKLRKMWKNTISMFGLSNVDSTCLST